MRNKIIFFGKMRVFLTIYHLKQLIFTLFYVIIISMINIIANIRSGKGLGLKCLKKVTAYCADHSIDYTLYVTNYKGHATEIARDVTKNGGIVIAMGGDGTFHDVLNGISDIEHTTMGFIPSGRGNDFTRAAGFNLNPIKALKDILAGKTKKIDYIKVGNKRCLNVAGTGLDVKVLELAYEKSGLTYLSSLVYWLNHMIPCNATITCDDGQPFKVNCIMAGVCNGIAIGGNIRISPVSKIDDGFLDVIIMQMPENGKVMKILPKFVKGKHMDMPITTHIRCKKVTIESDADIELDGEIYRNLPFDCEVVEKGLTIFTPSNL